MNEMLMKKICRLSQPKLLALMKQFLKQHNYNILYSTKDYVVAEGDLPVCLIAHLDTVGVEPPKAIFYDKEANVMWSPSLLGADDRAGVYAIIQIIEAGYKPHVIFTTDEELGALGAAILVKQKPDCPLENLKAIFQLDRRGSNDCVFYDCDNPDFTKYVESFGFKEAYGSFSDISVIAPAWGVAAANLSIGYYFEHERHEFLSVNDMEKTIEKVKRILEAVDDMPSFAYIEKEKPKMKAINYKNYSFCLSCNKNIEDGNGRPFQDEDGYFYLCKECIELYGMNSTPSRTFDF